MSEATICGGEMAWPELVKAFAGGQFMWLDLAGLHYNAPLPPLPPHTSLLHGWHPDESWVCRIRWDEDLARVAILGKTLPEFREIQGWVTYCTTVPWGQVGNAQQARARLQAREPDASSVLDQEMTQIEWCAIEEGAGAISFLAPSTMPVKISE
jgi:hypothetical protein